MEVETHDTRHCCACRINHVRDVCGKDQRYVVVSEYVHLRAKLQWEGCTRIKRRVPASYQRDDREILNWGHRAC